MTGIDSAEASVIASVGPIRRDRVHDGGIRLVTVWLIVDSDEVELKAGDLVVGCGVRQAWDNRSGASAVRAAGMLDLEHGV